MDDDAATYSELAIQYYNQSINADEEHSDKLHQDFINKGIKLSNENKFDEALARISI